MLDRVVDEARTLAELATAPMAPKPRRRRKSHAAQLSFDFDAVDKLDEPDEADDAIDIVTDAAVHGSGEIGVNGGIPGFHGGQRSLPATRGSIWSPIVPRHFRPSRLRFGHWLDSPSPMESRVQVRGRHRRFMTGTPDSTSDPP